jgi:hypothetical protein
MSLVALFQQLFWIHPFSLGAGYHLYYHQSSSHLYHYSVIDTKRMCKIQRLQSQYATLSQMRSDNEALLRGSEDHVFGILEVVTVILLKFSLLGCDAVLLISRHIERLMP